MVSERGARSRFYLASAEGAPGLIEPRACVEVRRYPTGTQNGEHVLVKVDPPVTGQRYGLGATDLELLVLTPRLRGISWPPEPGQWVPVHIARVLGSLPLSGPLLASDIGELGWGEAYATREEADRAIARTTLR
jgi:hypothetical protein